MKNLSVFFLLFILSVGLANAQGTIRHQQPVVIPVGEQTELEFFVPGISAATVTEAFLFYRYSGDTSYQQQLAQVTDGSIVAFINPESATASEIEYYLQFETIEGRLITFPESQPENSPVRVPLVEAHVDENITSAEVPGLDFSVLSPVPGETVRPVDVMVVVALFYDEDVNPEDFKFSLYFNGVDITYRTDINPWLITFLPDDRPNPGRNFVRLIVEKDGEETDLVNWSFSVSERVRPIMQTAFPELEPYGTSLIPSGQFEVTARSQSYAGQTNELARTAFRVSGSSGDLRYSINGLFTTQESSRLQPQNRYGLELHYNDWFELQAGHIYPSLNSFLLSGRRVFGVNTALNFFNDNIQLQFLHGQLARPIDPIYGDVVWQERHLTDAAGNPLFDNDGNPVTESNYVLQTESNGFGAYKRDITAARIGFGSGRVFGWSLSALRVEDDMRSIDVIQNFNDLTAAQLSSLTQTQRTELQENQDLLDVQTGARSPQGNFALATDFQARTRDRRIEWSADLSASLVNNDISDGILNRERAEDLGYDLDDNIINAFDRLSWLIIINENMNALPLRINDGEASAFMPTGILAGRTQLNLNYFNHNLTLQYRWIGPDYSSLANTSQRRDIAGYTITDRFRMFNNTIYVTLGHENLRDNVINNREATTNSMTNRANVSWYPVQRTLPRISLGVRHRIHDNDVGRENPFLPAELVGSSLRNVRMVSADSVAVLPNPRDNTTFEINASVSQSFELFGHNHDASFNFLNLNTTDTAFDYGDFKSMAVGFQISTFFRTLPLRTNAGFNISRTEAVAGLNTIDITGFNVGGSYAIIENKVLMDLDFAITNNNSENIPLVASEYETDQNVPVSQRPFLLFYEPDFSPESLEVQKSTSYIIGGGFRYNLTRNHTFILRFNYTNVNARETMFVIPNDHMIQFRYVTTF